MNFEKDYPGTTVGTGGSTFTSCDINSIYGQDGLIVDMSILEACNYLTVPTDIAGRYNFFIGSGCDACDTSLVYMEGTAAAGAAYNGKCSCIDSYGETQDQH